MIKFLATLVVLTLEALSPSMAGDFNGQYTFKIASEDSNPICGGFLVSNDIPVRYGKISDSIQHANAGTLNVSGNVKPDGSVADVEANSSAVFVSIEGSLKTL